MDSSNEVVTVLPGELRLGMPSKMPQARSYLYRQQSVNSTYDPSGVITINIPRLQRSYLRKDSYLRFRVAGQYQPNTAGTSLFLDTCGAYGMIEKIEVLDYLGSTVLESIQGVPQLMSLLIDMGMEEVLCNSVGNVASGLSTPYTHSNQTVYQGAITTDGGYAANTPKTLGTGQILGGLDVSRNENPFSIQPPSTGNLLLTAAGLTPFSQEFAIPLPSFLGFLSDKMVPLHNGFTINITVASQFKPFLQSIPYVSTIAATTISESGSAANAVSRTAASIAKIATTPTSFSWKLSNIYLDCQILELGPVADAMVLGSSQGAPLVVACKGLRNYTGTVKANSPEFVLNLNLNVASLTNILWIQRASTAENLFNANCGARTRNFLQRWQFQYGSTILPQSNGIQSMFASVPTIGTWTDDQAKYATFSNGTTECFMELMKARPFYTAGCALTELNYTNYADLVFNNPLATLPTILQSGGIFPAPSSPWNMPRFACGLNLELAPKKKGTMISGLNTNGMNTSIRGFFHPSYLSVMSNTTVDAWAEYDSFINISPGIATTVSF